MDQPSLVWVTEAAGATGVWMPGRIGVGDLHPNGSLGFTRETLRRRVTIRGYNELAAIKNYDPDALVVLGLLGDTNDPGGLCQPYDEGTGDGAEHATRLREFVGNFGAKGLVGSVCAPDYNSFFDEAVALIDTTCDDFVPPE